MKLFHNNSLYINKFNLNSPFINSLIKTKSDSFNNKFSIIIKLSIINNNLIFFDLNKSIFNYTSCYSPLNYHYLSNINKSKLIPLKFKIKNCNLLNSINTSIDDLSTVLLNDVLVGLNKLKESVDINGVESVDINGVDMNGVDMNGVERDDMNGVEERDEESVEMSRVEERVDKEVMNGDERVDMGVINRVDMGERVDKEARLDMGERVMLKPGSRVILESGEKGGEVFSVNRVGVKGPGVKVGDSGLRGEDFTISGLGFFFDSEGESFVNSGEVFDSTLGGVRGVRNFDSGDLVNLPVSSVSGSNGVSTGGDSGSMEDFSDFSLNDVLSTDSNSKDFKLNNSNQIDLNNVSSILCGSSESNLEGSTSVDLEIDCSSKSNKILKNILSPSVSITSVDKLTTSSSDSTSFDKLTTSPDSKSDSISCDSFSDTSISDSSSIDITDTESSFSAGLLLTNSGDLITFNKTTPVINISKLIPSIDLNNTFISYKEHPALAELIIKLLNFKL